MTTLRAAPRSHNSRCGDAVNGLGREREREGSERKSDGKEWPSGWYIIDIIIVIIYSAIMNIRRSLRSLDRHNYYVYRVSLSITSVRQACSFSNYNHFDHVYILSARSRKNSFGPECNSCDASTRKVVISLSRVQVSCWDFIKQSIAN